MGLVAFAVEFSGCGSHALRCTRAAHSSPDGRELPGDSRGNKPPTATAPPAVADAGAEPFAADSTGDWGEEPAGAAADPFPAGRAVDWVVEPAAAGSSAGTPVAEAAGCGGGADVDGAGDGTVGGRVERDDVAPPADGRRSFCGDLLAAASATDVLDGDSGPRTEVAITWVPASASSTMVMPTIHEVEEALSVERALCRAWRRITAHTGYD